MIKLGMKPVGSVVGGRDVQSLPHLEPYMDGVVPIGTESQFIQCKTELQPGSIPALPGTFKIRQWNFQLGAGWWGYSAF